jgi:hypothetical protein
MRLLRLFCNAGDFRQAFQPHWGRVALARGAGHELERHGCRPVKS